MKLHFKIYHSRCKMTCLVILFLFIQCIKSGVIGDQVAETTIRIPVVVPVSQLKESLQVPINDVFLTSYPPWVNETLLRIGQGFTSNNFMQFIYGTVMGLGLSANTDFTRIFIDVVNIMNPDQATKRYFSNTIHFKYWSIVDLDKDPHNLFESLNVIHAIHATAGHNLFNKTYRYNNPIIPEPKPGQNPYNVHMAAWDAFQADLRNSRLKNVLVENDAQADEPEHPPVNQFAFVSSFWSLVHGFIATPEHVLIFNASEEELMSFLHYWAFIAAAMGIDDKYNICLQPNLTVAKQYFTQFLEIHVLSRVLSWHYEYKVFAERTLKALQELVPFAPGTGGMLYRICEDLLLIQCPEVYKTLNPQERMYNMFFGRPSHQLLRYKSIKSVVSFIWNGLIQVGALKLYHFNTLNYDNFTAGLHSMDEEHLRGSYNIKIV